MKPVAGLSRQKLSIIHVAKAQLDMSEEAYRELLRSEGGVISSKDLDAAGFERVMKRFDQLGLRRTRSHQVEPADNQRRGDMASAKQRAYIRDMWMKWHGSDDRRALGRWLKRSYEISDIRFATTAVAIMAIEGLRAMLKRKEATTTNRAEGHTTKE